MHAQLVGSAGDRLQLDPRAVAGGVKRHGAPAGLAGFAVYGINHVQWAARPVKGDGHVNHVPAVCICRGVRNKGHVAIDDGHVAFMDCAGFKQF
jgi:hypothetical protein